MSTPPPPPPPPWGPQGPGQPPTPPAYPPGQWEVQNFGNDPLVSTDLGSWISKTVDALKRSWKNIVIVQLLVNIPVLILSLLLRAIGTSSTTFTDGTFNGSDGTALGGILGVGLLVLIASFVCNAVGAVAASAIIAGDAANGSATTTWQQGLEAGKKRIGRAVIAALMVAAVCLAGTILCIIPGIIAAIVFTGTQAGVVTFERDTNVISRGWELTKPRLMETIGRACIGLLIGIVILIPLGIIGVLFGQAGDFASTIFSSLQTAVLGSISAAAMVVNYADLRNRQTPVTSAQLANEALHTI